MTFRKQLNLWGGIVFGTLVVVGGGQGLYKNYFGGKSAAQSQGTTAMRNIEISQCPEPFQVTGCKLDEQGRNPVCIFENTAQASLKGYPYAWSYTADDVQVEKQPLMNLEGLLPQQKLQKALIATDRGIRKIVVCSVNPNGSVAKGRLTPVGKV